MIYFVLYYSETSDRISLRWSNEFSVSPLFSSAFFLFACFFFFSVLFFCCCCYVRLCWLDAPMSSLSLHRSLIVSLFYVQNIFIVAVIFQWQNRLIWTMLNIKGKAKEILSTHGRLRKLYQTDTNPLYNTQRAFTGNRVYSICPIRKGRRWEPYLDFSLIRFHILTHPRLIQRYHYHYYYYI